MDTKVIIEVVCPYCGSKIMMKKKVEVTSKTLTCPSNCCGKELKIVFDADAVKLKKCIEELLKQKVKI